MIFLGEEIKKLGFGLMRLPMIGGEVDMEQTKQMADLFMAQGFTYFDTAYGYIDGKSEAAVRLALADRYPRESFQLATKLPAWAVSNESEAKEMFWTSLKRTGAGYFDFYLLHNLGVYRTDAFDDFGIWEFLQERKREGLIKHLGFSIHATADYLDDVLTKHPEMEFVQLQINYADWESGIIQARGCYETARRHNKPVIIMEPVKGGALSQTKLPKVALDLFAEANPNLSAASWAIRFAASLEGVITVLSGMSTIEQMKDNLSYMSRFEPLSGEEHSMVERVRAELAKFPQIPCTDCKYCEKGCPQDIAIPGTFGIMNDYFVYQDPEKAKGHYYWETLARAKVSECIECGQCEEVCPQSINIVEELGKAAKVLEG
ncbi:MAG: aldo/keto reductase [Syntrophomonadaceae bacterium]|jgi:predicted aldo/keto reductase-like oxidoreductase|nr:aldo/keto reductase [Syntrophomonadaceae bacterium]